MFAFILYFYCGVRMFAFETLWYFSILIHVDQTCLLHWHVLWMVIMFEALMLLLIDNYRHTAKPCSFTFSQWSSSISQQENIHRWISLKTIAQTYGVHCYKAWSPAGFMTYFNYCHFRECSEVPHYQNIYISNTIHYLYNYYLVFIKIKWSRPRWYINIPMHKVVYKMLSK